MDNVTLTDASKRYKYPWESLEVVGDSFFIADSETKAVKNIRQTVYAANKNAQSKGLVNRYKASRTEGGVKVTRTA